MSASDILDTLLAERTRKPSEIPRIPEEQVMALITAVQQVFESETMLLRLTAPIQICGDIHGQFSDLLRIFELAGYPPSKKYLFLGDYVDRGKYSVEVMLLLFAMKVKYKKSVFLLRGNHEDETLNRVYGFYDEVKRKYSVRCWKAFVNCFNWMPASALVSDRILCMHGGLSPSMKNYKQIESIPRPQSVPEVGLLCDLLWSDPDPDIEGWGPNDRGVSYVFGKDVVHKFCAENDLDLIVRAHEVVEDSFLFFADRKLVTIFSAPAYCDTYTNSGCVLCVSKTLVCSMKVLQPIISEGKGINSTVKLH